MASVLIIEDDADLRFLLGQILSSLGADACVALGSLPELEGRAGDVVHFDLALLDINLGPGAATGIDVYKWLIEKRFAGRIAFLTGHARSNPLVREASRMQGIEVLEKPIGIDRLETLLREAS